jgi:hypothetical protein
MGKAEVAAKLRAIQTEAGEAYWLADKARHEVSEDQKQQIACVNARLKKMLRELSGVDIVDQVAKLDELAPGETQRVAELDEHDTEFHWWKIRSKPADLVSLAVRLLDEVYGDFSEDLLPILAKKDESNEEFNRRHPRHKRDTAVHNCPRCFEGDVKQKVCLRCGRLGYLIQDSPPDDAEYDMTSEGKLALNRGEAWTLADERRVLIEVSGLEPDHPRVVGARVL